MSVKALHYRLIISPDVQTGINKPGFTAYCPTLGVADDGDTVKEAINNVDKAIKAYVKSLIEDKLRVPCDKVDQDFVTTTKVEVPSSVSLNN